MSEQHNFRYLLPPGNNFQFVSKFRAWLIASVFLMAGAIGALFVNKATRGDYMNWTIDFRGGTEMVFSFIDRPVSDTTLITSAQKYITADAATLRKAVEDLKDDNVEISEISFDDDFGVPVNGVVVRTSRFSALPDEVAEATRAAFIARFGAKGVDDAKPDNHRIVRATWSGDRLDIKSEVAIPYAEAKAFFDTQQNAGKAMRLKPWSAIDATTYASPDEGTKLYHQVFSIEGVSLQYREKLQSALGPQVTVNEVNSYGVGAKAGDKLRDDAAKSIIYAIALIMLYLAFRFDIRYAPGAAFATIHDAVMVIGVFALTWTEVSLTSVAGLLTVMGFSVNDTVIVFDRIRENQAKLKDKKLERIIDISINEMLVRTILTSSTVFATTLIMNIFGTGLVKNFAFAMNIGVLVGTYSSIFLATPIFLAIANKWYSGPAPARRRAIVSAPATKPEKSTDDEPGDE
jgi:preprotein translocase subunit SecF